MDQEAGDKSLVAQSRSLTITETVLQQLLDHFHQRDIRNIEEEARRERETMERYLEWKRQQMARDYEDKLKISKLFFQTVTDGNNGLLGTPSPAIASAPLASDLPKMPPLPQTAWPQLNTSKSSPNLRTILCLNQSSGNPEQPFEPHSSYRGALLVLQLNCSQNSCSWFGTEEDLPRHLISRHRLLPYSCLMLKCGQSFMFKQDLKAHTQTSSHKEKVPCYHCGKPFRDYNLLKQHYLQTLEKGLFQCSSCNEVFTVRNAVYQHRRTKCPNRFQPSSSSLVSTRRQPIPPASDSIHSSASTTEHSLG